MRRLLAAALLALAAPARAEPVLALRLGVGGALGSAVRDVPVADTVPVQFPIQLDALWASGPLAGGVYASAAPALAGHCGDATCGARVLRLGLQGAWTFASDGGAVPWAGLASGYEWVTEERKRGSTVTTEWGGWELVAAQGGVEWQVARWLALGPFALLSVGRYGRVTVDTGFQSATQDVANRAVHVWLQVGVRGRLVLEEKRP